MIKRLTVLASAILALLLIVIGFFLAHEKPAPTPIVADPAYEAAIVPPDSLKPTQPGRFIEAPESASEEAAESAGRGPSTTAVDQAHPPADSAETQPMEASAREDPASSAMRDADPDSDREGEQQVVAVHPERSDATAPQITPGLPDAMEAERPAETSLNAKTASNDVSATSSSSQPPKTYTVQRGDNLGVIAQRLYGDAKLWKAIADANPTIVLSNMHIGQVLALPADIAVAIPERPPQERVTEGPLVHTVRPGDSLYSIAKKYYGRSVLWKRIRDANRETLGKDLRQIQVGNKLTIPPLR